MMMETTAPVRTPRFVSPGQRHRIEAWGIRVDLLVTGAETDGRYAVIEYAVPPTRVGPALHAHREMEESFYVTEGTLHFRVGDETRTAPAGTFVHVPANTPHAFWNDGPEPARYVGTFAPAGFERYFVELGELAAAQPVMDDAVRARVLAIGDKYDVTVLGPPPGLAAGRS
jgi:quercetin dioxygenase-like cupin family protein